MRPFRDPTLFVLAAGVFALLIVASLTGWVMGRRIAGGVGRATVENINARIRAWWVMTLVFVIAVAAGSDASIVLFSLISFLALREFVTLAPTRPGDHRVLFWSFFAVMPLHYVLIRMGWYGMFSILIPVHVSLVLPIRSVLTGDTERFLERTAINQLGLMICVYFVSCVPALLLLRIPGYEHNARLMFFLVLVVQLSDVLQYIWGKTMGTRPLARSVSPNKTWEGLVGGIGCATAVGTTLWWATPFTPFAAASMSFVIAAMGSAGGLVMSAVKRDRGVKDYGTLIAGHGGILDRIDSLCFAAPVFFHLTRYLYAA